MPNLRTICAAAAAVWICSAVSGCGAGTAKQAAEATAGKYFKAISQKDWDTAVSMYGTEFFQKTPKTTWRESLVGLTEKLGDYQGHQLQDWRYQTHVGTGGSRQVTVLTYQVRYVKGESTERLTFLGSGDGEELRIVGHNINSPALLAPNK